VRVTVTTAFPAFSAAEKVVALNCNAPPSRTVMLKLCVAEVFTPPFAVPPLSISANVICAVPLAPTASE
jgi:hypothetical protein